MSRVCQPPDTSLLSRQAHLADLGKGGEQPLVLMNTEVEDSAGSC